MADSKQTLYLVDISSFIFRAFYAIRMLTNKKGEPVNAIYGVAAMLAKLVEEACPEYLAVVYDSKEPSFRKEIYSEYKANRSAPPDDLAPQFERIEELVRVMGIHSYRKSGVEADDLIATLTHRWLKEKPSHHVVIVTGDKDLMALVGDRAIVWDTMKGERFDPTKVEEKFGVRPDQIRDYLALTGDSSDNIPGVPGVGPKTAVTLLKDFGTLGNVLSAAKEGRISGKKGEVIAAHARDAELSAELATLHDQLSLDLDIERFRYQFGVSAECADFLKAMDFHSLLARWLKVASNGPGEGTSPATAAQAASQAIAAEVPGAKPAPLVVAGSTTPANFITLNDERKFREVLEKIDRVGEFGFDLETTSLNPREAEIVGIALSYDRGSGFYIPISHRGTNVEQLPEKQVLDALRPFLEDPKFKKIGQNLKYDWSVLMQQGLAPDGIGADTMVAAYVLEPEGRHNLETLASLHLNYEVTTYEQVCGRGKDQLCFDQVPVDQATRYSAEDAWVALRLWEEFKPKLSREGLMEIFARVELPLVPVLARMESHGVCIDERYLFELSSEFQKELRRIEERVQAFSPGPINLNSPKQLAILLFEQLKLPTQGKTKTGFSTDASVLDALAPLHEVPRLLLEYREIAKLKGTYVDPLPTLRDKRDGKLHASFHQTVTATGRLSSSDPNLQNIPIRTARGQKIRRAFIPCPGNRLVAADYSQIELRILAHMSGDPELVRSFQADEDVHRRTASEIFSVAPEQVSDQQRGVAKAINFGLMYGKTPFGLSQELKIPQREARDIIDKYFKRYSGVKSLLDNLVLGARERGYVTTLMGRKRSLPEIRSSNPGVRANAERMAMNTPIQGTAADLMKLAMIEIDSELTRQRLKSKLIIQVHDEVVLDCPQEEASHVQKLVGEIMENAMKLSVPLKVNSGAGSNWMEL